ncbi:uncharacterized protein CMC5_016020 [Chondromyces crocatus]|uniref:Esterase n=2 Tax=Chondromyces crocatus TaxID=52 RepID=A0A0K1E9A2_CHOCO|nr:uncharacterized protein CMC5_016020 [Chondromyces crocatus]
MGDSGAGGSCDGSGEPLPAAPTPFTLGGQQAWAHDEGFASGYFHTYDALDVGGAGARKVHVFLPRDYGSSCVQYPVVYMNDGDTTFWPGSVGKTWDVAARLAELYAEGAIPQVIVVAVHPLARDREYTHAEFAPNRVCCGVSSYADYLADRVKGFIDANYRTRREREVTAIVGSSHGGLGAFLVGALRSESFGLVGSLSPSFWVGLDAVHGGAYTGGALASSALLDLTGAALGNPAMRPRVWIDWGLVRSGGFHNAEIEAAATTRGQEMVTLLGASFGYGAGELAWNEDPQGEHDELSWSRRFPEVMKFFYGTSSP